MTKNGFAFPVRCMLNALFFSLCLFPNLVGRFILRDGRLGVFLSLFIVFAAVIRLIKT